MVRKNKNKIGGKISTTIKNQSLNASVRMPLSKNKVVESTAKPNSQGKTNFYNKYCNNKVQQNLVDAMNILIDNMINSKNKNEKKFVESLKKNSKMLPFLSFNKNTNKISMMMNGGADGDETPENESKCRNSNVVSVVRNSPPVTTTGIQAIQEQITLVNQQLITARSQNDQETVNLLIGQLQNLSMIETMARQRQQTIDIVNRRENWNMAGDLCNRITQAVFTGLSGYLAYLILSLVNNAGTLITSGAGGLIMLFCIIIVDAVSKIVNGVSSTVPSWLGGGSIMGSGRDIVTNITSSMNQGIQDTPELNNIIVKLNELGYTTNIIAWIILFLLFNVIAHISRIFMTSNQFTIGFTGISLSRTQNQQMLSEVTPTNTLTSTQTTPTPTPAAIDNISGMPALENSNESNTRGGYKSRKHKRKHKHVKRKSRKHTNKRKTRKGKKIKKKIRKTRKR